MVGVAVAAICFSVIAGGPTAHFEAARSLDATIAESATADRSHREDMARAKLQDAQAEESVATLALLGLSYQYAGQMKRAEAVLRRAFATPAGRLDQAYYKRAWPMFLRARGRFDDAAAAAKTLIADPDPVIQAVGHIESGLTHLAVNNWGAAGSAANAALALLRGAPGGGVAATGLLALQGEFYLRTAAREKGRAVLEDVAARVRTGSGPESRALAIVTLESLARAARTVGDWDLAGRMAKQMLEYDPHFAGSHYAVGLVAEREENQAAAAAAFAEALRLWAKADPDLPEAAEVRRKLRSPAPEDP